MVVIGLCILATWAFGAPRQIREFQLGGAVAFVRFSDDGKQLTALETGGGMLESWDLSTGQQILSIHMGGRVRMAAYNPGLKEASVVRAEYVARGEAHFLVQAKESEGWKVHSRPVDGLIMAPDRTGSYVFFPKGDDATLVEPVDPSKSPVTWPFKVARFGLDRQGKFAAVNTGDAIDVVSVPGGRVVAEKAWKDPGAQVEMDATSGKVVIIGSGQLSVWNYKTDGVRSGEIHREPSGAAVLLPGGRFVWMGDISGGASLIDLKDFSVAFVGDSAEMGSIYPTGAVDFSPDGSELAAGFQTGQVKVWRLPKGM